MAGGEGQKVGQDPRPKPQAERREGRAVDVVGEVPGVEESLVRLGAEDSAHSQPGIKRQEQAAEEEEEEHPAAVDDEGGLPGGVGAEVAGRLPLRLGARG